MKEKALEAIRLVEALLIMIKDLVSRFLVNM